MDKSEKFAAFSALFAVLAVLAILFFVPNLTNGAIPQQPPSAEQATPTLPPSMQPTEPEPQPEPAPEVPESETPLPEEPETPEEPVESLEELLEECVDKSEGTQKDSCLRDLAFEKTRVDLCSTLTVFSIDECLIEVAALDSNTLVCELIDSNVLRDDCFLEIALSEKDPEICLNILAKGVLSVSKWDECFKTISEEITDPSYCRFISLSILSGNFLRDDCYWNIMLGLNDSSLCNFLLSDDREQECLTYWGQLTEDEEFSLTICEGLTDLNLQTDCFNNLAIKDNNYLVCNYLSDENRDSCMFSLIDYIDENVSLSFCEEILWANKDDCYKKMALEKMDENLCLEVFDFSSKEDCFYDLAIEAMNPDLCEEVEKTRINSLRQNACFKQVAFNSKEAEVCERVELEEEYFECYYDLALDLESYSICNLITKFTHIYSYSNYPLQQMCIKNYAAETGTQLACSEVVDSELNQACLDGNLSFGIEIPSY